MVQIKLDRFKGIEKQEFTLEILTPMFLGGANPKNAEIRAASIKGALRFWWRALQAEPDVEELLKKEQKIFGSADDKSGGKSKVRIVVKDEQISTSKIIPQHNTHLVCNSRGNKIPIIKYLTMTFGTTTTFDREYVDLNSVFKIQLYFPKDREDVLNAFYLMVYCGGLGSKSRNGFGSLHIKEGKIKDLVDILKNKNFNVQHSNLRYAAFSKDYKIFESKDASDNPIDALIHAGKTYFALKKSLKPDNMCQKRRYLGLPLVPCKQYGRHAKWVFINIFKFNGEFKSRFLFLPHRLRIEQFNPDTFEEVFEHCKNNIVEKQIHVEGFNGCQATDLGGNYEEINII